MYACVGSYLARVTRSFEFRFSHYPPHWVTVAIALLIYINFFAHHFVTDIRLGLFAAVAWAYRRTWVYYRPHKVYRRMPLLLSFALVALFIFLAENVGTFTAIWVYPHQGNGWEMVRWGKYGSWFLLMIVSFILVTFVHPPQAPEEHRER
jgi:uncharacterized membrane protein YoaT (DUF817 family)